jgi:hypothetical protein
MWVKAAEQRWNLVVRSLLSMNRILELASGRAEGGEKVAEEWRKSEQLSATTPFEALIWARSMGIDFYNRHEQAWRVELDGFFLGARLRAGIAHG